MSDDTLDESVGDSAIDEQLTMGIDPWERNWMKLTIALLVGFFAAVTVAGFAAGFQLPGAEDRVDPRTVATEGPWADPGVTDLGNGKFEAYVLAQVWSFSPREITLPVGAEIDIYITSSDLQHGLKVTDTNVNIMVVPGQVSKVSYTFDEVGEFPYICHEYCGSGHAAMFGTVNVVSEADYAALAEGGGDAETESTDESTAEEGDE